MTRTRFAALFVLFTMACDGDRPVPTAPSLTTTPVLVNLTVQGPSSIPPGETVSLKAVARYSDGAERDVTSEATWASTQQAVATVSAGTVTGVALGRTLIRVEYSAPSADGLRVERRGASLLIVVKPDGTFILSGTVTEPVGVTVGNATVEVIDGPSNRVTTNSSGFYELFGVSGTFTLRASKQGYLDETRALTVSQDQRVDLQIKPLSPPATVTGRYAVTFTASSSCTSLPGDAKLRTYRAEIVQDVARLLVTLHDAEFIHDPRQGWRNKFSGKVFGDTVTFDTGAEDYYYYYYGAPIQEVLASDQVLGIWGIMTAPATPQTISGTLAGGFSIKQGGRSTSSCSAKDHQVVFTRK